ncbi:hypothetical protein BgiBS90_020982, partial [Biomphalaria glabrata]
FKELTLRQILPELKQDKLMKLENIHYCDVKHLTEMTNMLKNERGIKLTKIFSDPIHGQFEVHPACKIIIDTPQFQRLRFLKRIGACNFVFQGALHNRFEHALGVSHLAGKFVRMLRQNQPELGITRNDMLCVEIGGLCCSL